MAGEDEDDYMGDLGRFIEQSNDKRPAAVAAAPAAKNAVSGQSKKGKGKQRWQDKQRKESRKKTDNEKLTEALNCAIPPSNIGFKMLQQMGYKPGAALGKHGQGALEPVKVELKQSRTGLGADELEKQNKAKKARRLEVQQHLKQKMDDISQKDFRDRQRSSWQAGKIFRDYKKACAALAQLDDRNTLPVKPPVEADAGDGDKDEEEEEDAITEEDLQRVVEELRLRFYYCIYCGCKYDSAAQMEASCPGLDEDSH